MNATVAIDRLALAIGLSTLQCIRCAATLIPGREVFANGYDDGPVLCHRCKADRNHLLSLELEAEEGEAD